MNNKLLICILTLGFSSSAPLSVFAQLGEQARQEATRPIVPFTQIDDLNLDMLRQQDMPQEEVSPLNDIDELVSATIKLKEIQRTNGRSVRSRSVVEDPQFLLKKIHIEGSTVFSQQELAPLVRGLEGKMVSFADIQKGADTISAYYQSHGYATSQVFIPPQKIIDGEVTLHVLEAKVGEVLISGNRWFNNKVYQNSLVLQDGRIFDMADLEKSLREINNQPDRKAKVYLQASEQKNATDIKLQVEDKLPIHASYEYNLRGSDLTNRGRHVLHVTDNNVSGRGDIIEAQLSLAEQNALVSGGAHYELPVYKDGNVFSLDVSAARTRLQKDLRPLNVKGHSTSVVPGFSHTLKETARMKVNGNVRFEIKDSKTDIGEDKLSYDRMRVLVAGPSITFNDPYGRTFGAADLHVGIPKFLGASSKHDDLASRVNSGGQFTYASARLARIQRLPLSIALIAQASGQYSPSPLTSLEQFYLGGMYSVRGYSENDAAGDSGFSFSQELRIPIYIIPESWHVLGQKDKTWRDSLSLALFMDEGRVFNHKRQQGGSQKDRTLLGTGVGLRFYMTPDTNMQFDVGYPLGDDSSEDNDPQLHLSVRGGF